LIKNIYECKRYSAWQCITQFPDEGWTKNSINGKVEKAWNSRCVSVQCDT